MNDPAVAYAAEKREITVSFVFFARVDKREAEVLNGHNNRAENATSSELIYGIKREVMATQLRDEDDSRSGRSKWNKMRINRKARYAM